MNSALCDGEHGGRWGPSAPRLSKILVEPGHVQRGPAEVWLGELVHTQWMVAIQVVFTWWWLPWWLVHHHAITVQPGLGVNVTGGWAELEWKWGRYAVGVGGVGSVLAVGVFRLGVGRWGLNAAGTAHVVFALEGRLVAVLVADAFLFPPEKEKGLGHCTVVHRKKKLQVWMTLSIDILHTYSTPTFSEILILTCVSTHTTI